MRTIEYQKYASIFARSQTEPATMVAAAPVKAHWKNQPCAYRQFVDRNEAYAQTKAIRTTPTHAYLPTVAAPFASVVVNLGDGKI